MGEQIQFTSNIHHTLGALLENTGFSRLAVLVDENTRKSCLPLLPESTSANMIVIQSGEVNKNLDTCIHIWNEMTELQLDRKSILINLGGGVITDMGAFCASTYKRGIRYIQIPTTLLAMTDASLGGKTGVNFGKHKNHVGMFSEPLAIIIDPVFLESLNLRQKRSGYAEVIKHAIISGGELWEKAIFEERNGGNWLELLKMSTAVKADIVENDFKETGLRKVLNFGHSIGHQLESFSLQNGLNPKLHGEAIAEGMMIEAFLANNRSLLSSVDLQKICKRISSIFKPEPVDEMKLNWIRQNLIHDKKNEKDKLKFVFPEKIGTMKIDIDVDMKEIEKAIGQYNKLIA